MVVKKTLKLSEQAIGSVMVALTNALIQVQMDEVNDENVDPDSMDVTKILGNYELVLNESGTLDVLNPVIPFSIETPEKIDG
jgi:hypothetical protein